MVADSAPTRENPSFTCGFSHNRVAPGIPAWLEVVRLALVSTGWQRLAVLNTC